MNSFKRVREFQIVLELEVLVFEETGKPEYPEKNLSEQGWELTTNLPIGLPYSLSRQKTARAIESVTFNFGFQGNVDGVPAMQISRIQRGPQVTDFLIPIVLSEASQTVG